MLTGLASDLERSTLYALYVFKTANDIINPHPRGVKPALHRAVQRRVVGIFGLDNTATSATTVRGPRSSCRGAPGPPVGGAPVLLSGHDSSLCASLCLLMC